MSSAARAGVSARANRIKLKIRFAFTATYLSYFWKSAMPNTATIQETTETTTMPTITVNPPPLTADSTCPPMMASIVAYPIIRMMFKAHGILDGQ